MKGKRTAAFRVLPLTTGVEQCFVVYKVSKSLQIPKRHEIRYLK